MKKLCLLGGSNSVMKTGLSLGLCTDSDLKLSLGASDCLQNIHSICSQQEAINECDIIVSESNINDAYNVINFGSELNSTQKNIRLYYEELHRTGKPVIILIIPIMASDLPPQAKEVIKSINKLHRKLTSKYEFYLIDLDNNLREVERNTDQAKLFQSDTLHPNDAFMYTLGENIRRWIMQCEFKYGYRIQASNFYNIDYQGSGKKSNSRYQRQFLEITDEHKICRNDAYCVGIETWSDGDSEIIITSDSGTIVKNFNSDLSFNELLSEKISSFTFKSHIGPTNGATEPSVNVSNTNKITVPVKLTSLLFLKKNHTIYELDKSNTTHLNKLIPRVQPFIAGVRKALNFCKTDVDIDADTLRDAAISLESIDLHLSYDLMRMAREARPSGPIINQKFQDYREALAKGQTTFLESNSAHCKGVNDVKAAAPKSIRKLKKLLRNPKVFFKDYQRKRER